MNGISINECKCEKVQSHVMRNPTKLSIPEFTESLRKLRSISDGFHCKRISSDMPHLY